MPDQIDALETKQAALQVRVSEPAFYQRSKAEIQQALAELEDLSQAIEAAYERWQQLSERES